MPLPESSLSQIGRFVGDLLGDALEADANDIRILIGSPADAAPAEGAALDHHGVNLFFYRLEPGGFGPGAAPDQPWLLRLHCLVTAFGMSETEEESLVGAGENDLRLLGEVLRIFHEKPVLDVLELPAGPRVSPPEQQEVFPVRIQVIMQPLGIEEINHLWATQGSAVYRPSVAYEMSLFPVLPEEIGTGGPLVGALGLETGADPSARRRPFSGAAAPPPVAVHRLDTGAEDWAPRICFVDGGVCAESLSFDVDASPPPPSSIEVWVAGEVTAASPPEVTLAWETWDTRQGWSRDDAEVPVNPTTDVIDPEDAGSALTETVALPFDDQAGQMVLYASRGYVRGSDGAELTVRSNPLLINLYESVP